MSSILSKSKFAKVVALAVRLDEDRTKLARDLHSRDREFGLSLDFGKSSQASIVKAWLEEVGDAKQKEIVSKVRNLERFACFSIFLLGFFVGLGVSAAVFFYDGTHPINVVTVVAVFVVLPLLLSLSTVVLMLPSKLVMKVPLFRSLVDFLETVSPGRLILCLLKLLPQRYRDLVSGIQGTGLRLSRLWSGVRKKTIVFLSQLFAVGLGLGATSYLLLAVILSDLAFAWSSTLVIGVDAVADFVKVLSTPWQNLFPDAVPSRDFIEATRYFRWQGTKEAAITEVEAFRFGHWWNFIALAMVFYAIVPRIILLFVSASLVKSELNWLFENYPGLDAVLFRLRNDFVITQTQNQDPPQADFNALARRESQILTAEGNLALVDWSHSGAVKSEIVPMLEESYPCTVLGYFEAGAGIALEMDDQVITSLASKKELANILILVRALEPPTEEVFDFVLALRKAISPDVAIYVVPLQLDKFGRNEPLSQNTYSVWSRRVARSGEPFLFCSELPAQKSVGSAGGVAGSNGKSETTGVV